MTATSDRINSRMQKDGDLHDAFQVVRERYRDLIEQTPISSDVALLDIRKMLHLLREVEQHLLQAIDDGHLEDFRATQQQLDDIYHGRSK